MKHSPKHLPLSLPKAAPSGAGEIRIIGGQWKRTRLPVARLPGLRPTPDRVRETLFNWLGQDLNGWHCVDAFAGTGALGLEAASRGAASVQLVEQEAALVTQLQTLCQRLQAGNVQVRRGDGVARLRQCAPSSLDLVFLDPPFDSALFGPALQAATQALGSQGFIYLEAPIAWDDAALASLGLGLVLHRHLRAGVVHAHLLRRSVPPPVRPYTEVAVGVLVRSDGALLLSTRPQGKAYAGYWEFPGGKIEAGETVAQALRRELIEELGITIGPAEVWKTTEHDYPHALVRLHWCKVSQWSGDFEMREGQAMAWEQLPLQVHPVLPGAYPVLQWLAEERA